MKKRKRLKKQEKPLSREELSQLAKEQVFKRFHEALRRLAEH